MIPISIRTVKHAEQRYPTVGDWLFTEEPALQISVSLMSNLDYEFLVGLHELIEAYMCNKRSISEESVNAFDQAFEDARKEGDFREPGNQPEAPYYKEHLFATHIEQQVAAELGVDWQAYDDAVNAL